MRSKLPAIMEMGRGGRDGIGRRVRRGGGGPCGLWAASAPGLTRTGFGHATGDRTEWGAGKGLRQVGRREAWARKGQVQEGQVGKGQARRERLTAERTARIEAVTVFVSMPTPQKT
jgi:hypothetical protein